MNRNIDPLPWCLKDCANVTASNNQHICSSSRGGNIQAFIERGVANMEFIVRAVNAHDHLTAALRNLERIAKSIGEERYKREITQDEWIELYEYEIEARNALRAAEGGEA